MCERCRRRCLALESTALAVADGTLTITVVPMQSYYNYAFYDLDARFLSLPAHVGTEPVVLSDGSNTYPLMDTNGQPVVSGQLRGRMWLRLRFGAGGALSSGSVPAHFTVYEGLKCMEYSSNPALQVT